MIKKSLLLFLCFFSLIARADLPQNDLNLEDGLYFSSNMTETRFKQIIDSVVVIYKPIVANFGAKLTVSYNWNDSTVNAYAEQNGNEWNIAMFGGLARRPEVTDDGFALVVCHELGHHLAGFAFYPGENWAASEGQSDYFANHVCAKKVFAGSAPRLREFKAKISARAISRCDSVYTSNEDKAVCYRGVSAGVSLANLLAKINNEKTPNLEKPDSRVVRTTNPAHPAAQCRLDTYLAGSVCTKSFRDDIIPGRNNPRGQDTFEAQAQAFTFSCSGTSFGARPACWFAVLKK